MCSSIKKIRLSVLPTVQINLHHSQAASASFQKLIKAKTGITLIQEPWAYNGKVHGLKGSGTIYSYGSSRPNASCSVVSKDIRSWLLVKYCDRDLVVVKLSVGNSTVVYASVYVCFEVWECTDYQYSPSCAGHILPIAGSPITRDLMCQTIHPH